MEDPEELCAEGVPADFCDDDRDQLGEAFPRALALAVGVRLRDADCCSARLAWELLVSGVCRPMALRRVFPLIPTIQTHLYEKHEIRQSFMRLVL